MRLQPLIQGLGLRHISGSADVECCDITDDSRQVTPGCLFISRGSTIQTPAYILQAIDSGAVAVISEPLDTEPLPDNIAHYVADAVDQRLAGKLAERFFGEPAKRLTLIGITGTNGKSTIALLIQHLLKAANIQTGVIGTIFTDDGTPDGRKPASLTTPGAIDFSRSLARMADAGCDAVAAEVSSHALEQGRVDVAAFKVGLFTNLTQDHLDYHKTMQAYAEAKSILFAHLLKDDGTAVINLDDAYAQAVLADFAGDIRWTSLKQSQTDRPGSLCYADQVELRADSSTARFIGPWGEIKTTIPLIGGYNVSNTLQALAAAHAMTNSSDTLRTALQTLPQVPGRLERVSLPSDNENQPDIPTVLVDYAHTPDALENAMSALRPLTPGKLIVMFGCGGDRDRTKRPLMAQAACRNADLIYLTSDNPRTEDPDTIIKDALVGIPEARKPDLVVDADRAKAIRMAVLAGKPGDTVLLAGKGHEDYQTIGRENIHFDDREHAQQALIQWACEKAAQ